MAAEYERILAVKQEVLVYRLPPRPSNRGYRAADWGLDKPSWTGRMRIVALGNTLTIKLEDRNGELFAKSPITSYPSVAVESVLDSSRYFVLKIADDTGRSAFIGIGFADRGDAFDFNVTLQDHFNSVKKDQEIAKHTDNEEPLNLQLKEGETFKINLGGKLGSKTGLSKLRNTGQKSSGLLPPPPGGVSQSRVSAPSTQVLSADNSMTDLLEPDCAAAQMHQTETFDHSEWSEFTSVQPNTSSQSKAADPGWVKF